MASSPDDDARERAELALGLSELKYGRFWRSWPNMDRFEKEDLPPWWYAGLKYLHEILPAEAAMARTRLSSRLHLESHLYSFLQAQSEILHADRLQQYRAIFSSTAEAAEAFRLWVVKESRALIDSLLGSEMVPQESARLKSTPEDKKEAKRVIDHRVGRNLASLRAERGWSFDDLAHQSGVDRKTLMRCGNGGGVRPATKKKIADAFGISVAELEQ